MTRIVKNSILLGIIFLLVCGFNYYWIKIYKGKELKRVMVLRSKNQSEFAELKRLADRYTLLMDTLKVLNEAYYRQDKILPAVEDSKVSFDYFNTMASLPESYINFTFKAENKMPHENYVTTNYFLAGEALFYNLINFSGNWRIINGYMSFNRYNFRRLKKQKILKTLQKVF